MKYYLGTSGWFYKHWVYKFYPEKLQSKEWLNFYSKTFNSVEVNSTFYRFPFKNMVKGWYNKTPANFIFVLKANRLITHVKKLNNINKYLKSFYSLADLLEEKLGPILFQTPPSLHKDLKRLENFLKILKKDYKKYKAVVEFRHESWFCKEVYNLLKKYNVAFCVVSGLDMPKDVAVTADFSYFRFHGPAARYSSDYNKKELKDWAKKIKKIKCKEVYCFFNNDSNAYAVKNCLELKRLI